MKKWINGCPNQWINVLSQQTLMGWIQACSSLWVNDESSKEWVVPADGWHEQISELFWPGYICFHVHYAPKSRVHWILFPFHRWEAPGSWGTWLAQSFPWNYTAENKLWITDSVSFPADRELSAGRDWVWFVSISPDPSLGPSRRAVVGWLERQVDRMISGRVAPHLSWGLFLWVPAPASFLVLGLYLSCLLKFQNPV